MERLSFEILDNILSHFSNAAASDRSHFDNQQDLLAFTLVNKQFNAVARLHLARFIPIATTSKAQTILSLCDAIEDTENYGNLDRTLSAPSSQTFGTRVQSLLLSWPDQGKYQTRRTTVITKDNFIDLLTAFPSLRSLEFICLPFLELDDTSFATLRSLSFNLANLRNLDFTNSSFINRAQNFKSVAQILSLLGSSLRSLSFRNIPLDIIETADLPCPAFSLTSFSVKVTSPRLLNSTTLRWILDKTIERQSCKRLTFHLSTKITDTQDFANQVPPNEGFKDLETVLPLLAHNLEYLSLCGMRDGQTMGIVSKTTAKLRFLELYADYPYFPENTTALMDFPYPTSLEVLAFPTLPVLYGGLDLSPIPSMPSTSSAKVSGTSTPTEDPNLKVGSSKKKSGNVPAEQSSYMGQRLQNRLFQHYSKRPDDRYVPLPANFAALAAASSSSLPLGSLSRGESSSQVFTGAQSQIDLHIHHPDLSISSTSFVQELGQGNRLENLKKIIIPENARYMRRGKWYNNNVAKACRRHGIEVVELPGGIVV